MRNALLHILNNYNRERQSDFAENPLANFIRHDLVENVSTYFADRHYLWQASPGQGQWAICPWLASFDPTITQSAQRGYYPVYLFVQDMNTVYLSMNQGVTEVRMEFGDTEARNILSTRARIMRHRVQSELSNRYSLNQIDLGIQSSNLSSAFYEPGHAFGIRYDRNNMPDNQILIDDMSSMLDLYQLLVQRGGNTLYETDNDDSDLQQQNLEERRRIRYHRRIERNQRLAREAKRIHGYICQVCGFDFYEIYGELGSEYIEAHHLIPLSQLPENVRVRLSPQDDFKVVCSNCHRMIHRRDAPNTFEEFVALYRNQRN